MPTVTVIVPTYNSGGYLDATIESILSQSFTDFEVIVIDDCSTNDVVTRMRAISDPRLRVVINDSNLGVAGTRNHGLAIAQSEFIAHCDHDDLWHADKLARQVAYLRAHPEIGAATTSFVKFFADGRMVNFQAVHTTFAGQPCSPVYYKWLMYFTSPFLHSSLMVRREIIRRHALRYDEHLSMADDWEFYFRLTSVCDCVPIAGWLTLYNLHGANWSVVAMEEMLDRTGFLSDRIGALLGCQLSVEQGRAYLMAVTIGEPCRDRAALASIGRLIAGITERMIAVHQPSAAEAQLMKHRAAERWWRIVRRTAIEHGTDFLACYDTPGMPNWVRPPWHSVASGHARAHWRQLFARVSPIAPE